MADVVTLQNGKMILSVDTVSSFKIVHFQAQIELDPHSFSDSDALRFHYIALHYLDFLSFSIFFIDEHNDNTYWSYQKTVFSIHHGPRSCSSI